MSYNIIDDHSYAETKYFPAMKPKSVLFIFLLFPLCLNAQTVYTTLFSENFDPPSLADSLLQVHPNWNIDSSLKLGSDYCFHGNDILQVPPYLYSFHLPVIDISSLQGGDSMWLEFSHIAKTDFFDPCLVEWSTENVSDSLFPASSYEGDGPYGLNGVPFFWATNYPDWEYTVRDSVHHTMFKTERFNLNALPIAGDTNLYLKFSLKEGGSIGLSQYIGWFVDDIKVICKQSITTVNDIEEPLLFYPNPVNDVLRFPGLVARVQIFDVGGRLLMESANTEYLQTAHLPKGVYFIRIASASKITQAKFIKR